MYLTPTEDDRLLVFVAAELARRHLTLGLPLSAPEAVALACDVMHLAARRGDSFEAVRAAGRGAVAPDQLMDGVADLVTEIRLEVVLAEGSRLIVLRSPWPSTARGDGRLGAVALAEGAIELSPNRPRRRLLVRNTSDRPIRVSSHLPFWRANTHLVFDRPQARGYHLDIPAGSSLHWAPGESREVELARFGGRHGDAPGERAAPSRPQGGTGDAAQPR